MPKQNEVNTVTLLAGGDVGPVIKPVDHLAERIRPVMQQADIRFAQCERTYSKRGWPPYFTLGPGGQHSRLDPEMASIFKTAGIDVVSMASNHTMDWGPEPMLDTIERFRSMDIQVAGAGKDGEDARSPVINERNGIKIAILAYSSSPRVAARRSLISAAKASMAPRPPPHCGSRKTVSVTYRWMKSGALSRPSDRI